MRHGQGLRRLHHLRRVRGSRHPAHRPSARDGTRYGRLRRGAAKYRCPSGKCSPASRWIKADRLHTLIPRKSDRWHSLYRGRAAVEREFGRLKHEWAMLPLRVRRIDRVALHVDLSILARLAIALSDARAVPLSA